MDASAPESEHTVPQTSRTERYIAETGVPINTKSIVNGEVELARYDPSWPAMFERETRPIRSALGDRALRIEHIGSTSVPGLFAKPCIDILLVVADPENEVSYVPDLEGVGYILRIRDPDWNNHRIFKGSEINLNLHIWEESSPEIDRHLVFRDWLRTNASDRELYADTKRRIARQQWETVQDYAFAKSDVIREIDARAKAWAATFRDTWRETP
jgi:GrpB-like predicted nucleotidyltransferase (UPF0157 family)